MGGKTDRFVVDEMLVSNRSGRQPAIGTSVFPIIDKGNGLEVEVHAGVYRHNREHGRGMGHEEPLDTSIPVGAIDGVEQGAHTSEKENDGNS